MKAICDVNFMNILNQPNCIKINGGQIAKYLGVTLDPRFRWRNVKSLVYNVRIYIGSWDETPSRIQWTAPLKVTFKLLTARKIEY